MEDNFGFTEGGAPHTDESVKRLLVSSARAGAFAANNARADGYVRTHHNFSQVYVRCAEQGSALPAAPVPPPSVVITVDGQGYPVYGDGPPVMDVLPLPDISRLAPVAPSGFRVGVQIAPGWFQALPGDSFANGEFHEPPNGQPFRRAQKRIVPWSDAGSGYWVVV